MSKNRRKLRSITIDSRGNLDFDHTISDTLKESLRSLSESPEDLVYAFLNTPIKKNLENHDRGVLLLVFQKIKDGDEAFMTQMMNIAQKTYYDPTLTSKLILSKRLIKKV